MYANFYHGGSNHNGPSPAVDADRGSSGGNNVMAMMNEREAVALLQHLDSTDLEHLLHNDSKLKDLVDDLSQVRNLQTRHDDLVATNKSLAEYNLSLRPRLDDLKQQVAFQYQRLNDLKTSLAEGKTKLDAFVGRQRLDTVLALLQTETAQTEEASEELADKFCENGDIDAFLGEFLTKRAQAHQRRIKSEKFAEMIQGRAVPMSPTSSSAAHSTYANPMASGPAPYPTAGGFGMPQPSLIHR
ncbi:vacuolar protein sorting-associated protein 37B [Elysia marginata]|uniref:Vacuolar protein sorting-associated protein 37B n=1 Tax=Elysia marginata TaxID=1093978 RepID=A0AAV4GMK2_9GAST|nr:vacuolar protein sorting-associated protein 37B [Elysia marginata]